MLGWSGTCSGCIASATFRERRSPVGMSGICVVATHGRSHRYSSTIDSISCPSGCSRGSRVSWFVTVRGPLTGRHRRWDWDGSSKGSGNRIGPWHVISVRRGRWVRMQRQSMRWLGHRHSAGSRASTADKGVIPRLRRPGCTCSRCLAFPHACVTTRAWHWRCIRSTGCATSGRLIATRVALLAANDTPRAGRPSNTD